MWETLHARRTGNGKIGVIVATLADSTEYGVVIKIEGSL